MNHTYTLTNEEITKVINKYKDYRIENTTVYMVFRAKIYNTTITIYTTNKVLLQGPNTDVIQDEINELLKIENRETITQKKPKNMTILGTDEVGTGDYFGGIVVSGCLVPKDKIHILEDLGVKDSKKLTDQYILKIAPLIKKEFLHSTIILNNEKYNEITKIKDMNLNKIKAILHNKVIYQMISKNPMYDAIIVDGFTNTKKYFEYLKNTKEVARNVELVEGGEDKYIAIAAASVIARYHFLIHFKEVSDSCGLNLPKGAGKPVEDFLYTIFKNNNEQILYRIAKLNFKTTSKVKDRL